MTNLEVEDRNTVAVNNDIKSTDVPATNPEVEDGIPVAVNNDIKSYINLEGYLDEDDLPLSMLVKNHTTIRYPKRTNSFKSCETQNIEDVIFDESIGNADLDDTFLDPTFDLEKSFVNSTDSESNDDKIQEDSGEVDSKLHDLKHKKKRTKQRLTKESNNFSNTNKNITKVSTHSQEILAIQKSMEEFKNVAEALDYDTVIIENLLSSNNLVRIYIPPNGNCFFEAALPYVEAEFKIYTNLQLRTALCNHIEENKDYYKDFLASEDAIIDDEISLMRLDSKWNLSVCDMMPTALANFLHRDITIYTSIKEKPTIHIQCTMEPKSNKSDILLALTVTPGLEHYHTVINHCHSGFDMPCNVTENIEINKADESLKYKPFCSTDTIVNDTTVSGNTSIIQSNEQMDNVEACDISVESFIPVNNKTDVNEVLPTATISPSKCTPKKKTEKFKAEVTPIKKAKFTSPLKKVLKRKRTPNTATWKRNITKSLKESGAEYVGSSGKTVKAKKIQNIDCTKCRYKCSEKISGNIKEQLFETFWQLSYERKKDFVCSRVYESKSRTYLDNDGKAQKKKRQVARNFSLRDEEQKIVRVCKRFFLGTFNIGERYVDHAIKHKEQGVFSSKENRGRHQPHNKTDKAVLGGVNEHIKSFPTLSPHYTRKDTQREFLPQGLSVNKMYDLYREKMRQKQQTTASAFVYRSEFNRNYNFSFHVPKKDQCQTCTRYHVAEEDNNMTVSLKESYDAHQQRKERAREEKNKDKIRANSDPSFHVATFDLEAVLTTPCTMVSQLYYKRKLCVYNLSVYDLKTKRGSCYVWNETNGKRGSCEIGSCVYRHLASLSASTKHACMYSDSCTGQNRNQYMAAMMSFAIRKLKLEVIEHKFLESGHTHMECDSMHSAIEFAKKKTPIYVPSQWLTVMHGARRNKPYTVIPLRYTDFWDFKNVSKSLVQNSKFDLNGLRVNWLKIVWIQFTKEEPDVLHFKTSFEEEEFRRIKLIPTKKRGRQSEPIVGELPHLYSAKIPISEAKKEDLMSLCKDGVIPEDHHDFYNGLPCIGKKDKLPEADVIESECENSD